MYQDVSIMDVFTQFDPELWFGVIVAIAVFVLELVLYTKGIIFSKGDKRLQAAKDAGRMVIAKRVRCRYKDNAPDHKTINRRYCAQYEYTLNGKTKTKQIVTTGCEPPYTTTLYYDKGGKKVFSSYDVAGSPFELVIYIIPIVVAYYVLLAIGYEF